MKDNSSKPGHATYERLFGESEDQDLTGLRQFTINHLFADVWSREEQLSMRDRSMITVALLAAQGRESQLRKHITGALNQQILREQLLEIMIQVAHYAGWAAGNNGQQIVLDVCQQRDALVRLNEKLGEAQQSTNIDFLSSILADKLYFQRANGDVINKESYLAALSSGERVYDTLNSDEIKVGFTKSGAIVTLRVTTKGKFNGTDFSGQFRNVRKFVKVEGEWQCDDWRNCRI